MSATRTLSDLYDLALKAPPLSFFDLVTANTLWFKLKEGNLDVFKEVFIAKEAETIILQV